MNAFKEHRQLDKNDPIAFARKRFVIPEGMVYLDGNSLGMMSLETQRRLREVTEVQWAEHLITSWNRHNWIDLPRRVGDKIGRLIGAAPGQTLCCDSISVNLFKVLAACLQLRPGRNTILSTEDNFPTDLYMVQGLQSLLGEQGCRLVTVPEDKLAEAIDDNTAAVLVTEVNFRTGRWLDIAGLTQRAHQKGALMIADLAHSAGAVPVHLDVYKVDFAVGCSYKYLNGGPGAPAFVYVAQRHQQNLQQPLTGWMGHQSPFEFSPDYRPAASIQQMACGTPPVIAMSAVDAALKAFEGVTLDQLRQKSVGLSEYFLQRVGETGLDQQLKLISPKEPEQRGSQLAFACEHAYGLTQAMIERKVIPDFRAPNYLRIGFAPLYNSYADIERAIAVMEDIIRRDEHMAERFQQRQSVT